MTGGHSCDEDEACEASDLIDGHLDQVESALQEVESTGATPVCEEVQSSYHASCRDDASINIAACNPKKDMSFFLMFGDMNAVIAMSAAKVKAGLCAIKEANMGAMIWAGVPRRLGLLCRKRRVLERHLF